MAVLYSGLLWQLCMQGCRSSIAQLAVVAVFNYGLMWQCVQWADMAALYQWQYCTLRCCGSIANEQLWQYYTIGFCGCI